MLKKQLCIAMLSALVMNGASVLAAMAEQGSLVVHVTGLKNNNGSVRVAMFNSESSYTSDKFTGESAFRKEIIPIKNNSAEYTFANLPFGDYAIKLFHDEDNSGKFETGMFGIP
ncbi:MAG: DUF2141 domain-containing protein, partial [Candidatus Obscuribacterales bacterium]|nr:DUF2141 domain-containing protein [Candidatus Obscuribacterales bacterium]